MFSKLVNFLAPLFTSSAPGEAIADFAADNTEFVNNTYLPSKPFIVVDENGLDKDGISHVDPVLQAAAVKCRPGMYGPIPVLPCHEMWEV
jgi:hypothetical protein